MVTPKSPCIIAKKSKEAKVTTGLISVFIATAINIIEVAAFLKLDSNLENINATPTISPSNMVTPKSPCIIAKKSKEASFVTGFTNRFIATAINIIEVAAFLKFDSNLENINATPTISPKRIVTPNIAPIMEPNGTEAKTLTATAKINIDSAISIIIFVIEYVSFIPFPEILSMAFMAVIISISKPVTAPRDVANFLSSMLDSINAATANSRTADATFFKLSVFRFFSNSKRAPFKVFMVFLTVSPNGFKLFMEAVSVPIRSFSLYSTTAKNPLFTSLIASEALDPPMASFKPENRLENIFNTMSAAFPITTDILLIAKPTPCIIFDNPKNNNSKGLILSLTLLTNLSNPLVSASNDENIDLKNPTFSIAWSIFVIHAPKEEVTVKNALPNEPPIFRTTLSGFSKFSKSCFPISNKEKKPRNVFFSFSVVSLLILILDVKLLSLSVNANILLLAGSGKTSLKVPLIIFNMLYKPLRAFFKMSTTLLKILK